MPRIIECEQNSPEWLMARLGVPTASEFHRIVTPKGKLSAQADGLANRLLAEWATGAPLEHETTEWQDRGQEKEDDAISAAELILGIETDRIGFVTNEAGTIGCSPDRIRDGGRRGVEVKCPSAPIHVAYMRGNRNALDEKYRCQLAGQIWIAEFNGVDVVSFHPNLPTVHIAVNLDDEMSEFIGILSRSVEAFSDMLIAAKTELDQKYGIEERLAEMRKRREGNNEAVDTQFDISDEDIDRVWARAQRENG